MNVVWIINDSGHDFSAAESYGELVPLSMGALDRYDITGMYRHFNAALAESEPQDWILHTGPNVMASLACSIFSARHGRLNLLLWHSGSNGNDSYLTRKVVFAPPADPERQIRS